MSEVSLKSPRGVRVLMFAKAPYLRGLVSTEMVTGPRHRLGGGAYRGTSLIRNSPPRWGHHRALGTVLLQGPVGSLFLISEVPWYLAGVLEFMTVSLARPAFELITEESQLNGSRRHRHLVWFSMCRCQARARDSLSATGLNR